MAGKPVDSGRLVERFGGNREMLGAAAHYAQVAKGTRRDRDGFVIRSLRALGFEGWLSKGDLSALRRMGK